MTTLPQAGSPAHAVAPARRRLEWVDTGRGLAILLVVLYHATNWLVVSGVHVRYWTVIDEMLATMRMPLFFTLSGLFAVKWLGASWSALWNSKIRLFAWVFLLWELLGTVITYGSLTLQGREFGLAHEARKLLLSPVAPQLELWFLWALSLFFVVAKLARHVPVRLQLGVAAVLSLVAFSIDVDRLPVDVNVGWAGAAKYLLFFLAGIHLRTTIMAFAQRPARVLVGCLVAWVAVVAAVEVFDLRFVVGVFFLNCVLGVVAGIAVSRALSRLASLRRIGATTLPVYLVHTPLIVVLTTAMVLAGVVPAVNTVAPVVPVVLMAVAVLLSLGLHRLCQGTPAGRLYEPPPRLLVRPT